MPKRSKGLGVYLVVLLILMLVATLLFTNQTEPSQHKYTDIVSYFQQNRVGSYTLDIGNSQLTIHELDGKSVQIDYTVPSLNLFVGDVQEYILDYNEAHPDALIDGVIIPAQEIPAWLSILPTLLLIVIMVVFWVVMMRQTRGSGGNVSGFGKAKARSAQEGRKVTFADVAGADEEKEELVEIVEFLRSPGKFNSLGARIPKGVLLVGPPGTGKTLLARAVAGEADVQFFSISGSDFVEMFVGVGASRVRDLFDQAKKSAPSVIFIDEIDAVGRQRGAGLGGGHDEREQTLNQLLVEMDGFSANTGVIVLAATNRRDILDPALLRPGRFDREVHVSYPDVKGREEILKVHARNKPLGPDVDLNVIARTTVGFTGADLENLLNEAALLAARRNLKAITMTEIKESTIKVVAGPEKRSHVVSDYDKRITAYHEAGHALCLYYCPTQDPVHEISVIKRGPMGGYTMHLPAEDRIHRMKNYMFEQIVVSMGGRVAEQLVFDDISTGASHDLQQATSVARSMVKQYGFSEAIGPIVYGTEQSEVFLGRDYTSGREFSEETASEIDREVRTIIENAYQKTTDILKEHMDKLHVVSRYLFVNEKVDNAEFTMLMAEDYNAEDYPPSFLELPSKQDADKETEAVPSDPADGNPFVSAPADTDSDKPGDTSDSAWTPGTPPDSDWNTPPEKMDE